jgi:alkylation response protein AidB-like acyl-CoA dehydrogenase
MGGHDVPHRARRGHGGRRPARPPPTPIDDSPNEYLIKGNKIFISAGDADFYANTIHLVLARIEGDPAGTKGLSLFVVPRLLVGSDGSLGAWNNVAVTGIEHKMGIHGSATCSHRVRRQDGPTRGYLVGDRGAGMAQMFQMMNEARITCGLQGAAIANASYQQALRYAKRACAEPRRHEPRRQGRGHHQPPRRAPQPHAHEGVPRECARCSPRPPSGATPPWPRRTPTGRQEASSSSSSSPPSAKAYSTDKGFKVSELGVQIFGGYGYISRVPDRAVHARREDRLASTRAPTASRRSTSSAARCAMKGGGLFPGDRSALDIVF